MSEWTANFDGTDPLANLGLSGLDSVTQWVNRILSLPHLDSPLLRETLQSFGNALGLSRLVLFREDGGADRPFLSIDLKPSSPGPRGTSLSVPLTSGGLEIGELLLFQWPKKGGFSPQEERWVQLMQSAVSARLHQDLLERQIRLLQKHLPLTVYPQLKQARRFETLGEMTVGLAHDFNNILTTILGQTQLALSGLPPSHESHAPIEAALHAGQQAAYLSQSLLSFVRERNLPKTRLNLGSFVRDLRPFLLSVLGKKIPLDLQIEDNLPMILADRSRLKQALLNLVVNAKQAIQGHGSTLGKRRCPGRLQILIRRSPTKARVELTLEDNGPGIPLDVQKRIFDPFFSTKDGSSGAPGTGLGLPTVMTVLQEHGGELELLSKPGSGCRFVLSLPISEQPVQKNSLPFPGV